jgi:methionyl aminopeptidase
MRKAGRILAEILAMLREKTAPGITTGDLNRLAHEEMTKRRVKPSFLGYHGYPGVLCASVNNEIVHGIPGKKVLKEGDIIGLDCGVIYEGWQADSAITIPVGKVSELAQRLMNITRESMEAGIAAARGGAHISDIGHAVQTVAEAAGFSVVREYVGHGIGQKLHEEPQVPNFGQPGRGMLLRPGLCLAIEPMVNVGGWQTRVGADNWTVFTADNSLSAHFEHTIVITDGAPEILTVTEAAA